MDASNQKWPRRNPAHFIQTLLVVDTAAWAASFNTKMEASFQKPVCRRERDSNRETEKTCFLNSSVDWLHAQTQNMTRQCEAKSAAAGLAPTPPPCSSLLMATNARTVG